MHRQSPLMVMCALWICAQQAEVERLLRVADFSEATRAWVQRHRTRRDGSHARRSQAVHDKFAPSYEPSVMTLFKSELERVSKL